VHPRRSLRCHSDSGRRWRRHGLASQSITIRSKKPKTIERDLKGKGRAEERDPKSKGRAEESDDGLEDESDVHEPSDEDLSQDLGVDGPSGKKSSNIP
jgi:hypothetical protein